jgi:hypothetical protein
MSCSSSFFVTGIERNDLAVGVVFADGRCVPRLDGREFDGGDPPSCKLACRQGEENQYRPHDA